MPFKKGKSGNPAGKPKGTLDKKTKVIRDWFGAFIEDNLETITTDFLALKEPKDRLYFITHIAEFVLPKLQRTELMGGTENKIIVTIQEPPKKIN